MTIRKMIALCMSFAIVLGLCACNVEKEMKKVSDLAYDEADSINYTKIKEAPPAEFYSLITEVRRVGVHLNQVLKKANAGGFLDVPLIRESIEELHATQKMLYDTFRNEVPKKTATQ